MTQQADDQWEVILIDPRGVARDTNITNKQLDATEAVVDLGPAALDAGRWTVRVAALEVNRTGTNANTRCTRAEQAGCEPGHAELRAILEAQPHKDPPHVSLRPDLEAVPPLALRFSGDVGAPPGCRRDDTPKTPAPTACLRMGFGYRNVGQGPLELKVTPQSDGALVADVRQRVFRRDATPWSYRDNEEDGLFDDFDAGTASYHPQHGHWHYDNIFTGRLFSVEGTTLTPVLDPEGHGQRRAEKFGNCAHDGVLVGWDEADQEARGTNDSGDDCQGLATDSPGGIRIGLSQGWADVYAQGLPDQYFDFSGLGDGVYLAQIEIDVDGRIREGNEDNNFGYVLFKISNFELGASNATIDIIERGRGESHLDPNKVLVFGVAE